MTVVARALLVTVVVFAPLTVRVASAACAGPSLSHDERVRFGDELAITGDGFFRRCDDTPGPCSRAGVSGDYSQLDIVLAQGSRRAVLSTVRTHDFGFEVDVVVPATGASGEAFRSGRASLRVIDARLDRQLATSPIVLREVEPVRSR